MRENVQALRPQRTTGTHRPRLNHEELDMLSDLSVFRAHRLRAHGLIPWRRLAVATGLLGLLAAPLAAEPCDSLERRNNRQSVNLGSGWTLPIVANPGHLDASVAFTALGATDTAYRFHGSGAVEVLFSDG